MVVFCLTQISHVILPWQNRMSHIKIVTFPVETNLLCLRRLPAGLSPPRLGVDSSPVRLGSVTSKVALRHDVSKQAYFGFTLYHSTNALYSYFVHLPPKLCNLSNCKRRLIKQFSRSYSPERSSRSDKRVWLFVRIKHLYIAVRLVASLLQNCWQPSVSSTPSHTLNISHVSICKTDLGLEHRLLCTMGNLLPCV